MNHVLYTSTNNPKLMSFVKTEFSIIISKRLKIIFVEIKYLLENVLEKSSNNQEYNFSSLYYSSIERTDNNKVAFQYRFSY